jgi:nucleoside-diphosphate-sugar epimerase
MSRVLVIGANGYLGRHVFGLLDRQAELTVSGTSRSGSARWIRVDLALDRPATLGAMLATECPDVVVNCAGAVTGSVAELVGANVTGPANLLTALAAHAPHAKLVHLGSAAEYGIAEPEEPITEQRPPHPTGWYGVTKLAGTELVRLAGNLGLDTVVLRVFNPIGPGSPAGSLPGRVVAELRRADLAHDVVRLGSLDAVRDFVDVRDIAEAVLAAVRATTVDAAVLNIGSGRAIPVSVMVRDLVRLSGFTGLVVAEGDGSARSADVRWQQADISAIGRQLGWKPEIGLADSLRDMWRAVA